MEEAIRGGIGLAADFLILLAGAGLAAQQDDPESRRRSLRLQLRGHLPL